MYDINVVAANIKTARLGKGYSQDYIAYKLKISQNAYSKVELGHTKIDLERAIILAELLEVDLMRLLKKWDPREDVVAISHIPVIHKILEVVCRTTGMGFAAVARVTDDKWIACSVRDEIEFGLMPGDELKLETTICNEIRRKGQAVIIDHVANDETFRNHQTPAMYGFQSYISVPIVRQGGEFFGTLCSIDPQPHKLNNVETIAMFKLFAELISFHLNAVDYSTINPAKTQLKEVATAIITA